ncbi:MAG: S41 family peptidase [bacterium]
MEKVRKNFIIVGPFAILLCVLIWKFDLFATGGNVYKQIERYMEVLKLVDKLYVEEVDSEKLVNGAINGMLQELDPHTVFISKERFAEISEQFEGEFEGIGVEFVVNNKVPTIVTAITGSPSDRLGLRPGDKIIEIEGVSTYGITDQGVRAKLLGPKGTQVTITVQRPGLKEPFEVLITRDKIPIFSVTTSFMIDDETGFIKVGRFAKTTESEFEAALQKLETQNMKQLILDLRGNSGGYLDQAVGMADKFLDDGKRIVYTRGRIPNANDDYYATEAMHTKIPLIVLIDHGSASASEIVAGAIQDWDRGLIVGVTSFGKGLVQQQVPLKDGGALRVTTARYYTPSGRLIQRSYKDGIQEYMTQGWDDDDPNAHEDSAGVKPVFSTSNGRKVYGGGGISPDIVIKPFRPTATTVHLIQEQIFLQYGSEYATQHPALKRNFNRYKTSFEVGENMVSSLTQLAKSKNVRIDESEIARDLSFIRRRIKSQVARHLWGADEFYQIEFSEDSQVQHALEQISQAAKIAGLSIEDM